MGIGEQAESLPYCYWNVGIPPSSGRAGGISRISLPGRHLEGSPLDVIPHLESRSRTKIGVNAENEQR
jgi:hypothetical protein